MTDEKGYIKFDCQWIPDDKINHQDIDTIIKWRDKLHQLALIGCYDNGIGYGNISVRYRRSSFLITGSGTGEYINLKPEHITLVTDYNINGNFLKCKGPIKASSESLTHAIIYELSQDINAVVHIHNQELWNKYLHKLPTTDPEVEYGTPAMAYEVHRLFNQTDFSKHKICVMGGHKEGIIAFGKNCQEAAEILLQL